ncbi:LysR family transcriptional regulator [Komagataeibacter sp. FNDCR2]|uniref:LysR family transcriptional regulator n=1 Tax=Komagataeibacter sp. FNDCR2 TaxID=2878682 RepID=UPI001E3228BD|nr:LysR family transcriptional regulator [Komagataeibacter sp. FNDCR2]MCE2576607.1 LysR family transcriptional regulator [Komagataeibacter sp. FNDCR2]
MELSALIYFVSLVDHKSTHDAASVLNVSQSTISHAVSALEHAMAAPLITRGVRRRNHTGITTAYGQNLYRSSVMLLHWCADLLSGKTVRTPRLALDLYSGRRVTLPGLSDESLQRIMRSNLSLRMIGHFLTVCDVGSIAGAARRLLLTQPTVTRQLHKLESIVGSSLLVRSTCGVQPTASARLLIQGCQSIDRMYRRIMKDENISYFLQTRALHLAAMMPSSPDSSLTILLATLVRYWREKRFTPPLSISTTAAPTIIAGLVNADYDVGLCDLVDLPSHFQSVDVETQNLFLVLPMNSTESAAMSLPTIMGGHVLAVPGFGTGLRRLTDMFLENEGITPAGIVETQSLSLLLRLVIDGTCCALLPAGSFHAANVRAIPLPRRYRMTTRLVWKASHADMASIDRLRRSIMEIQSQRPRAVTTRSRPAHANAA